MKSTPEYHPLARLDLIESAAFYDEAEEELGDRFLAEAEAILSRLPKKAFHFRIRFEDIRRVNLPSFQHGIFYFIHQDCIIVLGILHGARDTEKELANRRERWV